MKYYKEKGGSVLMYTIFLISIAMIMAVVILNLSLEIFNNNEYQNIVRKLASDVVYKAHLSFKYNKLVNTDGSGFMDNFSCPTSVTMSGTVSKAVISTSLTFTWWELRCLGTYSGTWVQIVWNDSYTGFSWALFRGTSVGFAAWSTADATFLDIDNTRITFTTTWLWGIDKIDDNMNNDDYKVTSTGSYYYPNGSEDNDTLARKTIYFYLPPGWGFTNVFWSNKKYADYIAANPYNIDTVNKLLWQVNSGNIYIDANKNFRLKVVKFDKTSYNSYKELVPLQVWTSSELYGRLGYIQNSGIVSTGGLVKTGQEMTFDFVNNDYGVFLQNTSTGTLYFNLKVFSTSGSGVYINPINDSDAVTTKYLGNDIIIDSDGKYLSNQFEVVNLK